MKKILCWWAPAIVVLLLQACTRTEPTKEMPGNDTPIPVHVMALQEEDISLPVITSGQFTTDDEANLSFKMGGVVSHVLVNEGDRVHKGQLLAMIMQTEIKSQEKQAELSVEKAERDFTRTQNLYLDSVATLEQYQNARTALAIARQQLRAARFNRAFSEIRAVADGYVLKRFVHPGQVVAPGAAVIRTNGAGKADWVFKAGVSDKEWAVLQVGDKALIVTDADPARPIVAAVLRKSEGADPVTGAFTVELEVKDDKSYRLASGLFGKATIRPEKKARVWKIPYEALLDGNANTGYVFVTSDNRTASKIPVTISSVAPDAVHIDSGFERAGAVSVITTGSAFLSDKSLITVVN